jgi:hypothetical protein
MSPHFPSTVIFSSASTNHFDVPCPRIHKSSPFAVNGHRMAGIGEQPEAWSLHYLNSTGQMQLLVGVPNEGHIVRMDQGEQGFARDFAGEMAKQRN